jgi:hypothetical protein
MTEIMCFKIHNYLLNFLLFLVSNMFHTKGQLFCHFAAPWTLLSGVATPLAPPSAKRLMDQRMSACTKHRSLTLFCFLVGWTSWHCTQNQLADQIRGMAPNEEQYYDTVLEILATHNPHGDKWIRSNGRTVRRGMSEPCQHIFTMQDSQQLQNLL